MSAKLRIIQNTIIDLKPQVDEAKPGIIKKAGKKKGEEQMITDNEKR